MERQAQSCSAVAVQVLAAAQRSARAGRRFTLAVSPAAITADAVEALVQLKPALGDFHIFLSDTRFPDGTCAGDLRALLERLPLRPNQLHLDVADMGDPERAARTYEQELRAFFGLAIGSLPRFDGIVLQLSGGEVAGLLSNSRALGETSRLVVANNRASGGGARFVTLTPPVIQNAGDVFITACPEAAAAQRPCGAAGRLLGGGNVTLLVDETN